MNTEFNEWLEENPDIAQRTRKLKIETTKILKRACLVYGIDLRFMELTRMQLWNYYCDQYEGEANFLCVLLRASNPRCRGFARELRLIMQEISKNIQVMRSQGYDADAVETMFRLIL